MARSGTYRIARWFLLFLCAISAALCLSTWLLSVTAITEYRGIQDDLFLRGGRLFFVHYGTKWKGHKGALRAGEKLVRETDDELVTEYWTCPHCGYTPPECQPGQACEQCGSTMHLHTESINWEPPGGFKFTYLGLRQTYPYMFLSFDPRGLIRTHSTGWNLNIPTGVFLVLLPLIVLVAIQQLWRWRPTVSH